jgi:pyrimidine-nucleoside phosphorylase
VLKGKGDKDLTELSVELAAHMLVLGGKGNFDDCKSLAQRAIADGSAYNKFLEMVAAQGGDVEYIRNTDLFEKATAHNVLSPQTGYVESLNGEDCGLAASMLEEGDKKSAGIIFHVKPGEYVEKGGVLAELRSNNKAAFADAEELLLSAYEFSEKCPPKSPLVYARLS